MKEIFPCPIIPNAAIKLLYEQSASFFTLPTEAWALVLLNRWSHISVLGWVIPETPKLSCITMAQKCSLPQLIHLHTSTGGSAKCCDPLPCNMGSARALSFGQTSLWQDTASSMLPPAAMFRLLIVWPNGLNLGLQEERLRFWRQALIPWNWEPPAAQRATIQPKPERSTDVSYKTKLRGCTKYISVSQWHFKE